MSVVPCLLKLGGHALSPAFCLVPSAWSLLLCRGVLLTAILACGCRAVEAEESRGPLCAGMAAKNILFQVKVRRKDMIAKAKERGMVF